MEAQEENHQFRSFSERLRFALARKGISQNALARELETSQGTVSAWLMKGTRPNRRIVPHLCTVLGVEAPWLLDGSGPPPGTAATPAAAEAERFAAEHPEMWSKLNEDQPEAFSREQQESVVVGTARALVNEQRAPVRDFWVARLREELERLDAMPLPTVSYRQALKGR